MSFRPHRAALLALALPFVAGCDSTSEPAAVNIVATAQSDAQLSTLVQAVQRADLVATLQGPGPFTVFAPTNQAFTAAAAALGVTPEQLLANPALGDILLFHVAGGRLRAADLTDGRVVGTSLSGQSVTVVRSGATVGLDTDGDGTADATVVAADVAASNGIVHKIDAVLLPPTN